MRGAWLRPRYAHRFCFYELPVLPPGSTWSASDPVCGKPGKRQDVKGALALEHTERPERWPTCTPCERAIVRLEARRAKGGGA